MLKCPEKGGAALCGAPPRRIGSEPCRVGPPTRCGSASKAPKQPKREQEERATSHWDPAMSRWTSNATWLPHARLHHTETGTDKRWRSHFGSKRGGLYGVGGSVELVGVAGCGPIACFPHSWKLPSGSAVGHDLTRPTHRCYANRRLPYLPQTHNVGRRPYNDYKSCPAANNGGSQYRLAKFGAQWKSVGAADRGWHAGAAPVNPKAAAGADCKADCHLIGQPLKPGQRLWPQ